MLYLKKKIILGTVQFGLNYGINNKAGKTPDNEVFSILDLAHHEGIEYLDTADTYGDASMLIGKYHRARNIEFKILTKFRIDPASRLSLYDKANKSLEKLSAGSLSCYSFHTYKDFIEFPHLSDELRMLKDKKIINKIGISVYTNNEFQEVIKSDFIEVIQIPFNLLDNHNQRGYLMNLAKKNSKEIHTRSVFLQGLFFMAPEIFPEKLKPLIPYVQRIKNFAAENRISMAALALNYNLNAELIDNVLIGVENTNHLQQNIDSISTAHKEEIEKFVSQIIVNENELLNPVNWKN